MLNRFSPTAPHNSLAHIRNVRARHSPTYGGKYKDAYLTSRADFGVFVQPIFSPAPPFNFKTTILDTSSSIKPLSFGKSSIDEYGSTDPAGGELTLDHGRDTAYQVKLEG